MSWKCACLTDNEDNVDVCKSCKKERPIYKRLNFDNEVSDFSRSTGALFYLNIINEFIGNGRSQSDSILNNSDKSEREKLTIADVGFDNFNRALEYIDIVEKLVYEDPLSFDEDILGQVILAKYACFNQKGFLNNIIQNHEEALNEYYKAFKLDPSQESLYSMAISVIDIPLEEIPGFIVGDKMRIAQQQKQDIEIALFMKVIMMDPTSDFATKAAIMLIEKYKITNFPFVYSKTEDTKEIKNSLQKRFGRV